ncbi:MAG: hypothetical protein JW914_01300 [Syntrophaceae bacterium]|nr:hypothetical protein [Syntrophaceae bacterium]
MNMKYKKIIVAAFIIMGLLIFLITGYAEDPRPNPGMPTPSTGLPKIKVPSLPEKPDLLIRISGSGLGGANDLYPDNPGMGPSAFRVSGQVLNAKRAAVRGCEVNILLSADRKVSPDDRLLDRILITETIPPFDGARFGSATLPRKDYGIAGIPAGTYFICAKVDTANRIPETNENNNEDCVPEAIRIHPAGSK